MKKLFCEKCNVVTTERNCPSCGNKRLRDVNDEDFCFFVNIEAFYFEMLESTLQDNKIEVVGVPYYSQGVTYASAGRADGRKIYVRYKDIEQAKEICEVLFGTNQE